MISRLFLMGLVFVCWSSCTEKSDNSGGTASVQTAESNVRIFSNLSAFPTCVGTLPDVVFFSTSDGKFFICRENNYVETVSPAAKSNGAEPTLGLCGTETTAPRMPDVVPVSGQLAVSLPTDIDPCAASGFIVGFEQELPMKQAASGEVYFENLPAGNLSIIITADEGSGLTAGGKRGIRLSDVTSLPGVRREIKDFPMPEVSSISGEVKLAAGTDNAGILVYIPGTSFAARTDASGRYTVADVPAGIHNLYFEKDGFHRGQIERAVVKSGATTSATPILLQLSTGAEGFISIASNATLAQEWTVPVTVGATNDAVLMKISESPTFDNLAWSPVVTSTTYRFDSEGAKTLYVKFANANGLESSPFSDQITVDRFTVAEASLAPAEGVANAALSRSINIQLTKPKHAISMILCEDHTFSGCTWQQFSSSTIFTFANEGTRDIFVKYKDSDGYESHVLNTELSIDLFPIGMLSININGGASSTNSQTTALTISQPVNASEMIICENSIFSGCSWEPSAPARSWSFDSDGYKTLFLKFRDSDNFESESVSANIVVDTSAPVGTPTVSYTVRDQNMLLRSENIFDLSAVEMKVARSSEFANADWQNFNSVLSMPYSRNLKVQYRDSYGHTSAVIDLKVTYQHLLSEARSGISAAQSLGVFVFAGGYKGSSSYSAVVDIYNSTTAFWSTATLSEARSNPAVAVHNGKIYFAGGDKSGGCSSTIDIYDVVTETWVTAALSVARCGLTGASAGDTVAFAGGYAGSTVYDRVDLLDTTSGIWTTGSLSTPRRFLASSSLGTNIYFIGGNTNTGSLMTDVVDIYDSAGNIWDTANAISAGKSAISAISVDDKIFIAGGSMQSVPIETDVIEYFDPENDQWTAAASVLSTTRQSVGVGSANGLILFIGGIDFPSASGGSANPSSVVDVFNPSSGATSSSAPLSTPRKSHGVASDGTTVIVAGGMNGTSTYTNKVDIYEGSTWYTTY